MRNEELRIFLVGLHGAVSPRRGRGTGERSVGGARRRRGTPFRRAQILCSSAQDAIQEFSLFEQSLAPSPRPAEATCLARVFDWVPFGPARFQSDTRSVLIGAFLPSLPSLIPTASVLDRGADGRSRALDSSGARELGILETHSTKEYWENRRSTGAQELGET